MINSIERKKKSFGYRVISLVVLVTFTCNLSLPSVVSAQALPEMFNLPAPGTMINPSGVFTPTLIKGVKIDPVNPLKFNFIVDTGDERIVGDELKAQANRLIKYFMAAVTVPDADLWVNLSPYEKNRIMAEGLGQTDLGKDLLAQDYILKQLTATLIYPESDLGKTFWAKIYQQAQAKFGTTDVPVNTFSKVWIVPSSALIYENEGTAFIVENKLKVMLEEDYLAASNQPANADPVSDPAKAELSKQILKDIIVPAIEKEVNEGKNFAPLRQIANSIVLAVWYKQNLQNSIFSQLYADQNKTKGVDAADKDAKQKIYNQYLEAFKKGTYNLVKDEYDAATQEVIQRKYFSGGAGMNEYNKPGVLKVARGNNQPSALQAQIRRAVDNAALSDHDFDIAVQAVEDPNADPSALVKPTIEDLRAQEAELAGNLARAQQSGGTVQEIEAMEEALSVVQRRIETLLADEDYKREELDRARQSIIAEIGEDEPDASMLSKREISIIARIDSILDLRYGVHGVGIENLERSLQLSDELDSLEKVDFVMDLEDEFSIPVSDEDMGKLKTLGDVYDYFIKNVPPDAAGLTELKAQEAQLEAALRSAASSGTTVDDEQALRESLDRVRQAIAKLQSSKIDAATLTINPRWQGELAPYVGQEGEKVINPTSERLIADLTAKYSGAIKELLAEREAKQEAVDAGRAQFDFMAGDAVVEDAYGNTATAKEIRESDWKVNAVPEELTRPGAILTGPWSDEKWAINSLSGGAVRVFRDFEDAGWDKGIAGIKAHQVGMDILSGKITSYQGPKKAYSVPERSKWPVVTTRVRGLHFSSKFFNENGVPVPAMIEDLVLAAVNTHEALIKNGSGVYFVVPKLQSAKEIKTVVQILADLEKSLGYAEGTFKIIMMLETIELTLEEEEALWAGRKHIAVTNVGRWDKMATDIRVRRNNPNEIMPDPVSVGVGSPHMKAYIDRNVAISLKRGAEPEGGMVVQMMSRGGSNPETDKVVVERIKADKRKEAEQGMKFAWVATPQVVGPVNEIFQNTDYSNRVAAPVEYTAEARNKLLELPQGKVTKEGVRRAVYDSLAYMIGARTSGGAVAIIDESMPGLRLMQDLAVLKINQYWLWTLVHHLKKLDDTSDEVNAAYIQRVIDEQVQHIKDMPDADKFPDADWNVVASQLKQMVTSPKMVAWESINMLATIDENDPVQITAINDALTKPREQVATSVARMHSDLFAVERELSDHPGYENLQARQRDLERKLAIAQKALAVRDAVLGEPTSDAAMLNVAQRTAAVEDRWAQQKKEGRWLKRFFDPQQIATAQPPIVKKWETTNYMASKFNRKLRDKFRNARTIATFGPSNNMMAEAMALAKIKVVGAKVTRQDLLLAVDLEQIDALYNDLIANGYIDSNGIITEKYYKEASPINLQLDKSFVDQTQAIFETLDNLAFARIEGLYLGGWDAQNQFGQGDQAKDQHSYLGRRASEISELFIRRLKNQEVILSETPPEKRKVEKPVDYYMPLFVDFDEGHLKVLQMTQTIFPMGQEESLISAVHIEDQAHGCKKCGHMSGKVLDGTAQWLRTLGNARFALDQMGLNSLIVARTDAEAAEWITSHDDGRDQPFLLGVTNVDMANQGYHKTLTDARRKKVPGAALQKTHKEWIEKANLKTIQEAVAEAINGAVQSVGMTVEEWNDFVKTIPAEYDVNFIETVKAKAKEIGVNVYSAEEWKVLQERSPEVLQQGINILWDFQLTRTEEQSRTMWMINSGIEMAIARNIAAMPYADISWFEQHKPGIGEVKHWAEALDQAAVKLVLSDFIYDIIADRGKADSLKSRIGEILTSYHKDRVTDYEAYLVAAKNLRDLGLSKTEAVNLIEASSRLKANNTSPSFYWAKSGLSEEEMKEFLREQGKYTQFQFATYFGSVFTNVEVQSFLEGENGQGGYLRNGMWEVAQVQRRGRERENPNRMALNSQRNAGNPLMAHQDSAGSGQPTAIPFEGGKGDTMDKKDHASLTRDQALPLAKIIVNDTVFRQSLGWFLNRPLEDADTKSVLEFVADLLVDLSGQNEDGLIGDSDVTIGQLFPAGEIVNQTVVNLTDDGLNLFAKLASRQLVQVEVESDAAALVNKDKLVLQLIGDKKFAAKLEARLAGSTTGNLREKTIQELGSLLEELNQKNEGETLSRSKVAKGEILRGRVTLESISGLSSEALDKLAEIIISDVLFAVQNVRGDAGALTTKPDDVGGIDFNPKLMNIQIKRDGNGVPLPLPQQPIENMKIEGFMPVIINVTPINNLPLMLGFAPKEENITLSSKS